MYLRMLRQRLQVYGGDLARDLDLQRCETFTIALQYHLAATCQLWVFTSKPNFAVYITA